MLIGEFRHNIDAKGRINFPSKFRDEIGEVMYVTRWLDDCLVVFPEVEWQKIAEKLNEKSIVKSRDVQRFIYSSAVSETADKQGRILIPQTLREHAGLTKDVVIIGAGSHAEIWDLGRWEDMNKRMRSSAIEAAMEELEF